MPSLVTSSVLLWATLGCFWASHDRPDTFWTPVHMAICLGGILGGVTCGWLIIKNTFLNPLKSQRNGSASGSFGELSTPIDQLFALG